MNKYLIVAIAVVISYLIWALIARVKLPPFERKEFNAYESTITFLLAPIMDTFGYRKATHWFDWEDQNRDEFNLEDIELLTVTNGKEAVGKSGSKNFTNITRSLGGVSEGAIIRPKDYDGYWSLSSILEDRKDIVQLNKLKYEGEIKIIVDGGISTFGISEYGELIELELVEYIDRSKRLDVLHI